MTGASVGTLHDEAPCWPQRGELLLNRCRYGAFIDGPVDAREPPRLAVAAGAGDAGERISGRSPMSSSHRSSGTWAMARTRTTVLIEKERLQRRARRRRARHALWRAMLAVKDGLLAITVAYGRQPLLALVWLAFFWALGVAVFGYAERQGAFKPNSAVVLRSPEWTLCGVDRSEQRFLASTQTSVERTRRKGTNPVLVLPAAVGGIELSGDSIRGCTRWMSSCLCSRWIRRHTGDPIHPSPPEDLPWAITISNPSWDGSLSLLAVAGFSGHCQIHGDEIAQDLRKSVHVSRTHRTLNGRGRRHVDRRASREDEGLKPSP